MYHVFLSVAIVQALKTVTQYLPLFYLSAIIPLVLNGGSLTEMGDHLAKIAIASREVGPCGDYCPLCKEKLTLTHLYFGGGYLDKQPEIKGVCIHLTRWPPKKP